MGIICYQEKHRELNRNNKKNILIKQSINATEFLNSKNININEIKESNNKEINDIKKENKSNILKNSIKPQINNLNIYEEILKIHNEERIKCDCKKLTLNKDLNKLAQKCADNFSDIEECNNKDLYGINYALFSSDNISEIIKICNGWINEKLKENICKYNSITKHYTQIIWKSTKEIGIGFSKVNSESSIFVIYYSPAGNIFDKFNENIK